MMTTPNKPEDASGEAAKKHEACSEIFKKHMPAEEFRQFIAVNEQYDKAETAYSEQIAELELKFRSGTLSMVQQRGAVLKKLPGFWAQALLNHKDIKPFTDDDQVQKFLRDYMLDVELVYAFEPRFGDANLKLFGRDGIVIKAEFKQNPAFSNTFLTKAFGKRVNEDDCEIAFCQGCTINWTSDKLKEDFLGPTASEPNEGGDDEDGDNVDWFSFFGWWQLSTDELSDEHQIDENGMDKFAKAIIDDVWSKPMEYFDLVDSDSDDEDEEEEDSDEDDSDEDGDDMF